MSVIVRRGGLHILSWDRAILYLVTYVGHCHRSEPQIGKTTAIRLTERLASLGIVEVQLKALLEPLGPSQHYRIGGFEGVP